MAADESPRPSGRTDPEFDVGTTTSTMWSGLARTR
jgi:hypothetical protein